MNSFDLTILHFFNAFAGRSHLLDSIVGNLQDALLLNGGFVMAMFWWSWMREDGDQNQRREILVSGLIGSACALLVARFLAVVLPFRERPMANPIAAITIPEGLKRTALMDWSSFPSDHATLFFSLAVTLWFVSRKLGALALIQATVFVCFTRIYSGVHYPTDLLAGAALGTGIALIATSYRVRTRVATPVLRMANLHPAAFYTALFLVSFEISEMFSTVLAFLHPSIRILHVVIHTFHHVA